MPTSDQLNARLEALKKALGSGVLSVQYTNGERVQYRSVAELRTAIGAVEQDIAQLAGGAQVVRTYKLTSSKDL